MNFKNGISFSMISEKSFSFKKLPQVVPGRSRLDIRKNFSTETQVRHWKGLTRTEREQPSLEVFEKGGTWHFVMGFSGHRRIWSKVGLGDLESLLQP